MESLGLHRVKDRYVDIFMHTNVQSKRDYESSQSIGRWFALVYGEDWGLRDVRGNMK